MSNLIIGNKYVPISKSIFGPLNSSNLWEKAQKLNQPYLYYVGKNENDLCFSHVKNDALYSDFFLESDVIPYEEEFVLPKRWFIERNEKNYKVVNKWAKDQKLTTANYNVSTGYIYSEPVNNKDHRLSCVDDYNLLGHNLFTEINFEQFQEFVLKIKTNNMKQIGWKFKPNQDQFIKAACAIVSYLPYGTSTINSKVLKFEFDEESIEKLRDADVLELWFEPVYEEEFKVDDWVTVLSVETYDYDKSNGKEKPEIGKVYKIREIRTDLVRLFSSDGWMAIKSFELRKATIEEIEASKLIDIAGYKAEKVKDGIKFGCQTIPTSVLDALEDLMERSAFTTTLKIESTKITLDIIKKLKNL